tara:strand:+ start:208 stop:597 length:390 start_codon:yes stop_codon:yes gene_type:complete
MKTLLTIFTLVFTVMFSSTSFAGWTKVGKSVDGVTFYVDYERIRKHGGYVYWWELTDHLKPTKTGRLSSKVYKQGDCKLFRNKILSDTYYNLPLGRGEVASGSNKPQKDWNYPPPNSVNEAILTSVCSR